MPIYQIPHSPIHTRTDGAGISEYTDTMAMIDLPFIAIMNADDGNRKLLGLNVIVLEVVYAHERIRALYSHITFRRTD